VFSQGFECIQGIVELLIREELVDLVTTIDAYDNGFTFPAPWFKMMLLGVFTTGEFPVT
jgi:hypothetical protein